MKSNLYAISQAEKSIHFISTKREKKKGEFFPG